MITRPNVPPRRVPVTRPRPVLIEAPSKSENTKQAARSAQTNSGEPRRSAGTQARSDRRARETVFLAACFSVPRDGQPSQQGARARSDGALVGLLETHVPFVAHAPVHSASPSMKKCRAIRRQCSRCRSSPKDGGANWEPPLYITSRRALSQARSRSARAELSSSASSARGGRRCRSASTKSSVDDAIALRSRLQCGSVMRTNLTCVSCMLI
mmetsp:Transcript_79570/g.225027  ORF Transcript_79570/g.225027 Transcript_79570/m.225027 type:complete len:212 (-) Transcript_79570:205-840(-)